MEEFLTALLEEYVVTVNGETYIPVPRIRGLLIERDGIDEGGGPRAAECNTRSWARV